MSTRLEVGDRTSDEESIRCPDCGWTGERSDLVMTKAARLQCPECHDGS
jgi:DNA-directed RNA polymerase subunit RPC12/RpoP